MGLADRRLSFAGIERLTLISALILTGLLANGAARAADEEPVVVRAVDARIRAVGGPSEGAWNLWTFGSVGDWFEVAEKRAITVVVTAAGRPAKDVFPRAELAVGTRFSKEFDVADTSFKEYSFQAEVEPGLCVIEVGFLNDFCSGGEDRNLLVKELRITGAALAAEVPTVKKLTEDAIRKNRMGTLVVRTKPGAAVKVTQLKHEFGFGTAIASDFFNGTWDDWTRGEYLRILRENFNCAVLENALKWPQSEPQQGRNTWEVADAIVKFCNENEIALRGHCVFWEVEECVPGWVRALSDKDLRAAVAKRIDDVCKRYKGKIAEYDVNNEMIHGSFFAGRLGEGVLDEMFVLAHKVDPRAPLYVNDFILTSPELAKYEEQIAGFIKRGVPVGGIGWQGHFHGGIPSYRGIMNTLDRLAAFKLPVKVTEFDINTDDEQRKARDLEDFYRICFAHPGVDGILMWGFWEGAHWIPKASLWKGKFVPTQAAEAYRNLVFKEWWTTWEGKADDKGRCEVGAFFGTHRVEAGGKSEVVTLSGKEKIKTVQVGR